MLLFLFLLVFVFVFANKFVCSREDRNRCLNVFCRCVHVLFISYAVLVPCMDCASDAGSSARGNALKIKPSAY